jgi:hypothetical protein
MEASAKRDVTPFVQYCGRTHFPNEMLQVSPYLFEIVKCGTYRDLRGAIFLLEYYMAS